MLTQAEGTAILYSKSHSELSKDARLANPSDRERSWTICIVYNPKRNQKVEQAIRAQMNAGVNIAIPVNCKMALEAEQQIKLSLGEKELNADPL